MKLNYQYQNRLYSSEINWTKDNCSMVFRDIKKKVEDRHSIYLADYYGLAENLDTMTDNLYERLYALPDTYSNTYSPAYPRILEEVLSEIEAGISSLPAKGDGGLLRALYRDALGKMHEFVEVFLEDNTYQNKIRSRNEYSIETTREEYMTTDFEDTLIRMTDFASLLNCLTETQRRRFVKYYFLKNTLQEIADQEHTTAPSIFENIKAAMKKIQRMARET